MLQAALPTKSFSSTLPGVIKSKSIEPGTNSTDASAYDDEITEILYFHQYNFGVLFEC